MTKIRVVTCVGKTETEEIVLLADFTGLEITNGYCVAVSEAKKHIRGVVSWEASLEIFKMLKTKHTNDEEIL